MEGVGARFFFLSFRDEKLLLALSFHVDRMVFFQTYQLPVGVSSEIGMLISESDMMFSICIIYAFSGEIEQRCFCISKK